MEAPDWNVTVQFGKRRNLRLQILLDNGLEERTFNWPDIQDGLMTLGHAQFKALFAGLDWRRVWSVEARRRPQ